MTTAHTPPTVLRVQADRIAKTLKAIERGDVVPADDGRMAASRKGETITFGVAMDDKIIKIELSWSRIRETDERFLSDFIVQLMQRKAGDA